MAATLAKDSIASASSQPCSHSEEEAKSISANVSLDKSCRLVDGADEETTDVGHTSGSDSESSSALSSDEGHRGLPRRCRFGNTSLGTIPSTPCAGAMSLLSPPGLSRAALRQARDSCKANENSSEDSKCLIDVDAIATSSSASASSHMCRFGKTMLGTVPKTPVNGEKWKALANVFGSPPGLSRTEKRRARDECKGPVVEQTSWKSAHGAEIDAAGALSTSLESGQKQTARERLGKLKKEAGLLRDLRPQIESHEESSSASSESEEASDKKAAVSRRSSSSSKAQQCRLSDTSFGTVPSTPLGNVVTCTSPPGLSRKTMRQVRDSYKAPVHGVPTWGAHSGTEALTIKPSSTASDPRDSTLAHVPR